MGKDNMALGQGEIHWGLGGVRDAIIFKNVSPN
jgi:hypothetical protein